MSQSLAQQSTGGGYKRTCQRAGAAPSGTISTTTTTAASRSPSQLEQQLPPKDTQSPREESGNCDSSLPRLGGEQNDERKAVDEIERELCSKAPHLRNMRDIKRLHELLIHNSPYFQSLQDSVGKEETRRIVRCLKCKRLQEGDLVYQENDRSEHYFIVLHGSVRVFMRLNSTTGVFREFSQIQANKDFGKMELYDNRARMQTVISAEETILLLLDRKDYAETLRAMHHKQLDRLIAMLRQFTVFANHANAHLLGLLPFFLFRTYTLSQSVYSRGDNCEEVYFVLDGEFILCTPEFSEQQDQQLPMQESKEVHSQQVSKKNSGIQLIINHSGDIFGEEEALSAANEDIFDCKRQYSAICTSQQASVLVISIKDFEHRLMAQEKLFSKLLRERFQLKFLQQQQQQQPYCKGREEEDSSKRKLEVGVRETTTQQQQQQQVMSLPSEIQIDLAQQQQQQQLQAHTPYHPRPIRFKLHNRSTQQGSKKSSVCSALQNAGALVPTLDDAVTASVLTAAAAAVGLRNGELNTILTTTYETGHGASCARLALSPQSVARKAEGDPLARLQTLKIVTLANEKHLENLGVQNAYPQFATENDSGAHSFLNSPLSHASAHTLKQKRRIVSNNTTVDVRHGRHHSLVQNMRSRRDLDCNSHEDLSLHANKNTLLFDDQQIYHQNMLHRLATEHNNSDCEQSLVLHNHHHHNNHSCVTDSDRKMRYAGASSCHDSPSKAHILKQQANATPHGHQHVRPAAAAAAQRYQLLLCKGIRQRQAQGYSEATKKKPRSPSLSFNQNNSSLNQKQQDTSALQDDVLSLATAGRVSPSPSHFSSDPSHPLLFRPVVQDILSAKQRTENNLPKQQPQSTAAAQGELNFADYIHNKIRRSMLYGARKRKKQDYLAAQQIHSVQPVQSMPRDVQKKDALTKCLLRRHKPLPKNISVFFQNIYAAMPKLEQGSFSENNRKNSNLPLGVKSYQPIGYQK